MAIGMQKHRNEEKEEVSTESVDDLSSAQDKKPLKIAIVATAIVVAIAVAFIFLSRGRDAELSQEESIDTDETEIEVISSNGVYDADGITLDPDGINPGLSVVQSSNTTTATVYSSDDFIKDLNGLDISAVFEVSDISYVYDYVSYEKRRALIDDGMEFYWLEAEYQGKKYRIEIPFTYFKDIRSSGICRVLIEVLTIKNGGKVISYMRYEGETE